MIGSRLLHYRITDRLGAGGMGEVWRAVDEKLDRAIALKILPNDTSSQRDRLERFKREARALAALDHPNIVTVYSIEEQDDLNFLTMALVEGDTLGQLIPDGGMDLETFFNLATPLADALAAAHQSGIVHRDLKPGNVMVSHDGRVRVLDFGLAKLSSAGPSDPNGEDETVTMTQEGAVVGTVPYMSPEQVSGQLIDHRSDIFSLGVVLYEMVTGKRPFEDESAAGLISSILRDDPAPVKTERPDVPLELDRLIRRCLAKATQARPQTALGLREELEAIRRTGSASGERDPERVETVGDSTTLRAIAVLPLANLSGDPGEEYFADGMTEALITDIAKVGRLKVISRTSVMQFKGVTRPIADIARELGVDAVVEGSVLRAGDRVRITAQLIRAATDEHLWAERYDRSLEDVLSLQDEVARAIATQIDATLGGASPAERPELRKVDPEVFQLVLKGRHYWNMRTKESAQSALECFQQAIDIDPSYAPAHVGVADSLNILGNYGLLRSDEIHRHSLAAAERALELDGESTDAYRARALIRWQFEFDWEKAGADYRRALELDPNSPLATYWYAVYLSVIGYYEQSLQMLDRAEELDPLSLMIPAVRGWIQVFRRRPADGVPHCRRVLEIDPNFMAAHWFLGQALVEMGEYGEGIAALEKALELSGGIARLHGYLGYSYGRAGRTEEARAMLKALEALSETQHVSPYFFALVHSGLEETELALDRLEQAYAERDSMVRDLRVDPHWDRMSSEHRFQTLMQQMDYPDPPNDSQGE